MNCVKVGKLIRALRLEKQLTQKQLADAMHLSDRTVSKWERGLGCPDISLLGELAGLLGVSVEKLLAGELSPCETDGGNMKKLKFYVCPTCGNVVTATGEAEVSCCGRKLAPLPERLCDEAYLPHITEVEDEYYVSFPHEMRKDDYISFIACASWDRLVLVKLYPEQPCEARFPRLARGRFFFGSSRDGVWAFSHSAAKGRP